MKQKKVRSRVKRYQRNPIVILFGQYYSASLLAKYRAKIFSVEQRGDDDA